MVFLINLSDLSGDFPSFSDAPRGVCLETFEPDTLIAFIKKSEFSDKYYYFWFIGILDDYYKIQTLYYSPSNPTLFHINKMDYSMNYSMDYSSVDMKASNRLIPSNFTFLDQVLSISGNPDIYSMICSRKV